MKTPRQSNHDEVSPGKQNTTLIDRLSDLPDGIICHILSFLPTKLSAATSILSKRWRFLWVHVPNLNIDSCDHKSAPSLSNTINTVLSLRKIKCIDTFQFDENDIEFSYDELETWIAIAIEHNVQNLSIGFAYISMLPPNLCICKTLVDLQLHHCVGLPSSENVFLPSLKKLELYSVEYEVDEALPQLLSGCPVLEELTIDGLVDDNLGSFIIDSPTMKKIEITFLDNNDDDYSHYNMVEINCPALEYIRLTDLLSTPFSTQMLPSLTEAEVHFDYFKYGRDDNNYFPSVMNFFYSLCEVKCLQVSTDMKIEPDGHFADQRESVRKFDNLTKLEWAANWFSLMTFLKIADHLEVLIISEFSSCFDQRKDENLKQWVKPRQVPTCLVSNLKTVRIDQFRCTKPEFMLVKYLLKNATVLKKMEIYFPNIMFDSKAQSLHKISLFARGSEDCDLTFY